VSGFRRAFAAGFIAALSAGLAAAEALKRAWPQEKCFPCAHDWDEALRRSRGAP
jgi:hypothetical protein